MAILGLLAYKATKGLAGSQPSTAPANTRVPPGGKAINVNGRAAACPKAAVDWAICCSGGLGGLLAGGAAGSVLSGGLNDLLKQFQQNGHGEAVNSWVGTGPNKAIAPKDLGRALGSDQINALRRANRNVARGIAQRPQPILAASGRPSDAARAFADRTGSSAHALTHARHSCGLNFGRRKRPPAGDRVAVADRRGAWELSGSLLSAS